MTLLAAKLVDELEAVGLGHVLGDVVKLLVTLVALLLRDNPVLYSEQSSPVIQNRYGLLLNCPKMLA